MIDHQDFVVISGHSDGLGKELSLSLPPKSVIGMSRHKTNIFKEFSFDISKYKITETYLSSIFRELENERIALVLCAGTLGESGGILNSELEDWENTIRTNLFGNLSIIKAFLPHMIRNGYGKIIFVSGGGADRANPLFSGYSISKVAIVREVENIAKETSFLNDFSIIALAPGAMKTKMLAKVFEKGGEVKTTVEISETVAFIKNFLKMDVEKAKSLSGRFIHVRDNLNSTDFENKWMLRRIQ